MFSFIISHWYFLHPYIMIIGMKKQTHNMLNDFSPSFICAGGIFLVSFRHIFRSFWIWSRIYCCIHTIFYHNMLEINANNLIYTITLNSVSSQSCWIRWFSPIIYSFFRLYVDWVVVRCSKWSDFLLLFFIHLISWLFWNRRVFMVYVSVTVLQ